MAQQFLLPPPNPLVELCRLSELQRLNLARRAGLTRLIPQMWQWSSRSGSILLSTSLNTSKLVLTQTGKQTRNRVMFKIPLLVRLAARLWALVEPYPLTTTFKCHIPILWLDLLVWQEDTFIFKLKLPFQASRSVFISTWTYVTAHMGSGFLQATFINKWVLKTASSCKCLSIWTLIDGLSLYLILWACWKCPAFYPKIILLKAVIKSKVWLCAPTVLFGAYSPLTMSTILWLFHPTCDSNFHSISIDGLSILLGLNFQLAFYQELLMHS